MVKSKSTDKVTPTETASTETFTATSAGTTVTYPTPNSIKLDPNQLLHYFLENNNLKLTVTAIEDENPFVGTGFILTQKPLLKISVEYK